MKPKSGCFGTAATPSPRIQFADAKITIRKQTMAQPERYFVSKIIACKIHLTTPQQTLDLGLDGIVFSFLELLVAECERLFVVRQVY
jgi:hypothetical protein